MDGWGTSGCPVDNDIAQNGCDDWEEDKFDDKDI